MIEPTVHVRRLQAAAGRIVDCATDEELPAGRR